MENRLIKKSRANRCRENPIREERYGIRLTFEGRLMFFYDPDLPMVEIGIPAREFGDNHHLQITINGAQILPPDGPSELTGDIKFHLRDGRRLCFYHSDDPDDRRNSIDLVADFDKLHKNPSYPVSGYAGYIYVNAGSFYTECSQPLIKFTTDILKRHQFSISNRATKIGCRIFERRGGSMEYPNPKGGTSTFDFDPNTTYEVAISNVRPSRREFKDGIVYEDGDFTMYYDVVKKDSSGSDFSEGEKIHFGVIDIPSKNNPDVPCMPAGGGFPPAS